MICSNNFTKILVITDITVPNGTTHDLVLNIMIHEPRWLGQGSLKDIPNLSEFQKSLSFRKSRCFINVLMRFYWIFNQKYILDRAFRFLSEKFPVLNLELFLFHHFYNLQKFLKCIYQEMSFVPVSIATFCSLFSDDSLYYTCYYTRYKPKILG